MANTISWALAFSILEFPPNLLPYFPCLGPSLYLPRIRFLLPLGLGPRVTFTCMTASDFGLLPIPAFGIVQPSLFFHYDPRLLRNIEENCKPVASNSNHQSLEYPLPLSSFLNLVNNTSYCNWNPETIALDLFLSYSLSSISHLILLIPSSKNSHFCPLLFSRLTLAVLQSLLTLTWLNLAIAS